MATLCAGIGARAQQAYEYIPFPTANVTWTVFYEGSCMQDVPPSPIVYRYSFYGDTIVNGKIYKKLGVTLPAMPTAIPVVIGGLREEDKKVYYSCFDVSAHPLGWLGLMEQAPEMLLYDFNAGVGDVVVRDSNDPSPGLFNTAVQAIDTVLFNGTYRRRYNMGPAQYASGTEYWIEGVGSMTDGLISKITPIPTCGHFYWENVCFQENGNVRYQNPDYLDCEGNKPQVSISGTRAGADISIFPNPATAEIHVDHVNSRDGVQARIMDYTGRTLSVTDLKQENNTVPLPSHASFCILLLNDRQGRLIRQQKIVVR